MVILTAEARQHPMLPLPAIFTAPQLANKIVGQIIEHFLARLRQDRDVLFGDAGFFP